MTRRVFAVIGGGIAGLRISLFLKRIFPSWRVVLLESTSRLGGRIHTINDSVGGTTESGAGRFGLTQERVMKLLRRYGLAEKIVPISGEVDVRRGALGGSTHSPATIVKRLVEDTDSVFSTISLRGGSVHSRVKEMYGEADARTVRYNFEYDTEITTLDASLATEAILGTFRGRFAVLSGGMEQLIHEMVADARQEGVEIHTGVRVDGITRVVPGEGVEGADGGGNVLLKLRCFHQSSGRHSSLTTRGVVIATTVSTVRTLLPPLIGECDHLYGERVLVSRPLMRVYAKFPTRAGVPWFQGVSKFTTRFGLRYFLPINPTQGIAMISYTDGTPADAWELVHRHHGKEAVVRLIVEQLRIIFPDKEIPLPSWSRIDYWREGCHYWAPGADVADDVIRERIHPDPTIPLYVTGEMLSVRNQCWVEGALEMAEATAEIIYQGVVE